MAAIDKLMMSYSSYHRDPRNKATHFLGVPMIVYALLIPLGWLRFSPDLGPADFPLTGAAVFLIVMVAYYLTLDKLLAIIQIPIIVGLFYVANRVSLWPRTDSAIAFGAAFVGGWALQFLGHYFEGKRPALFDNLLQIFNAPLFLAMEVVFMLGMRRQLRQEIEGG